ncbi:subtilase family protein [Striga asiatica]|uniref:Subtilase family protein n=1 Tax=Striga asiatica TaxID=4170 RepID=A0A5A7PCA8_STRAF|nr:subtilase family protein [Striga asiatica]
MGREINIPKISVIGSALILGLFSISFQMSIAGKQTYIVGMIKDMKPASFSDHSEWYASSLASVSNTAKPIYIYNHAFHGYSAILTHEEAELMKAQPEVSSLILEKIYRPLTTRTPFFLGLENLTAQSKLPNPEKVSDLTIGVLDTGVWPESQSFRDNHLGPIPKRWRGRCDVTPDFNKWSCNKKLIGARSFLEGYRQHLNLTGKLLEEPISPRDYDGHGTHTSSTAAGSAVPGANLFGFANGTARGMAVAARIASYKVCGQSGCPTSDILAGMDAAIWDGVDVLSLSLGGPPEDYYMDPVAIGAFAATERGILVSCSAGNSGPAKSIISNVAPWILTVGAGTIDRDFPKKVTLGDGRTFTGVSLYVGQSKSFRALAYAANVSIDGTSLCTNGSLIPAEVKGKIVLCDRGVNARVEKGLVVKEAGGKGMVLANTAENGEELVADAHFILALQVGEKAGDGIRAYVLSQKSKATAKIGFGGTKIGVQPSPVVAAFSSRGPNHITVEILKPDLIAPGLNILAAWSRAMGPTGVAMDTRKVDFNIISGTSMACPHVSGLAALLKAAHPEWSPAAIRSALMTTAYSTYNDGRTLLDVSTGGPSTPFAHGSGHVNPVRALDPGLIYDLTTRDYLHFLCAISYTSSQIKSIVRTKKFECNERASYSVYDLNYPSFAAAINSTGKGKSTVVVFTRKVTNVGQNGTKYQVSVTSPSHSAKIYVTPDTLVFRHKNETKSYKLKVVANPMPAGTNVFGSIVWSDDQKHAVASPVSVSWV